MERLIPEKEDLQNEFKSDLNCLPDDDIVETIVGFANTKGGTLFLGVEDDGTITGIHKKHRDITKLAAFIGNKTIPSQSVRVDMLDDKVIIMEVPMSRTVVATSGGKVMRRRIKMDGTPETIPMFPTEIAARNASLGALDYSSQALYGSEYGDFDPLERERLRKTIRNSSRGDQSLLELNDEEFDKALQFVVTEGDRLIPTVAGMLMLGKEESIKKYIPTTSVAFQVLEGTEVRVNDIFVKPIVASVERIEEYFDARNPEREMEYGLIRMAIPEFSKRAFREAVVNAFAHRDYAAMQMIRIMLDDDGLSITNPGGFVEGVTLENLLTVEPHGRNMALADALKRVGLAERTGRGIDRIYEGSLMYGRPIPDYSSSDNQTVRLFIQRVNADLAFTKMVADEENRLGRSLPIQSLLILSLLKEHRRLNARQLRELTHLDEYRIRSTVEKLTEASLIEAYGETSARFYTLSSKVYQENNASVEYVRQKGINRLRYQELIVELARSQESIKKRDVVELLHVTESQAYRLLDKLIKDGRLVREGNTVATVYKLSN